MLFLYDKDYYEQHENISIIILITTDIGCWELW